MSWKENQELKAKRIYLSLSKIHQKFATIFNSAIFDLHESSKKQKFPEISAQAQKQVIWTWNVWQILLLAQNANFTFS